MSESLAINIESDGAMQSLLAEFNIPDFDSRITVISMLHIAKKSFFDRVNEVIKADLGSLVLTEGVMFDLNDPEEARLNRLIDEGRDNLLEFLRLVDTSIISQKEGFKIPEERMVNADLQDVGLLRANIEQMLTASNMIKLMRSVMPEADQINLARSLIADFSKAYERDQNSNLVKLRNNHLIDRLENHLEAGRDFIIPWGQLHIPGIISDLKSKFGAVLQSHRYVTAIDLN